MRRTHASFGVIVTIALAAPRLAHAAGAATWWVDMSGPSCEPQRAAFEREVTLACEAVGGTCGVAKARTDAELLASVACGEDDGAWTLETRTREGTLLARTDLDGPKDDRLREAAVEIARDAAPERVLAVDSLQWTLSDGDSAPPPRWSGSRLALAGVGRLTGRTGSADASTGAGLLVGVRVAGPTHVLGLVTYEAGGQASHAFKDVRAAVGAGWGAPVDKDAIVGLSITGGLDVVSDYLPLDVGSSRPKLHPGAFGGATFFLQAPLGTVRPFAALDASVASQTPAKDLVAPALSGTLVFGLAFGVL
jgi:hypothetical protein